MNGNKEKLFVPFGNLSIFQWFLSLDGAMSVLPKTELMGNVIS